MDRSGDACIRCSASLSLIERFSEETGIEVPGKGTICPNCYKDLSPEEFNSYFRC